MTREVIGEDGDRLAVVDPWPTEIALEPEDDSPASRADHRYRWITRRPRTVIAAAAAGVLVAAVLAGYTEGQRSSRRTALESSSVLAWASEQALSDASATQSGPTDVMLHFAVVGVVPLTIRSISLARSSITLHDDLRIEPGTIRDATASVRIDCTGGASPDSMSLDDAVGTAVVVSDAGVRALLPVTLPFGGPGAFLRPIQCLRNDNDVEVAVTMAASPEADLRLMVSTTSENVTAVRFSSSDRAWALAPAGTIPLTRYEPAQVRLRLTFQPECSRVSTLTGVTGLIQVEIVTTNGTVDNILPAGWDDAAVTAAATAAQLGVPSLTVA